MKVARLYSFRDIRIEEIPIPQIGAEEALVEMKACGICTGEVMPWYIERKAPLVPGHEPAGVLVKVGPGVQEFREGDRVFVHHHTPCFQCHHCRRGDFVHCATWKRSRLDPGGLAEYVRVPEENLRGDTLKLPEGVSFEDGTLVEPTGCVVKSLRRAGLQNGDVVVVIGLGIMGQLHVLLARHYGARLVIGADKVSYRLRKASEFGADVVVDGSRENLTERIREATDGAMANVVIVGPGTLAAMETGLACAGRGGTVLFFGPTPPEDVLSLRPHDLYFSEVSLVSSYSCGPRDTREALNLIAQRIVSAEKVVTHRFPLENTAEAFRLTAKAGDSLKAIVVFE